MQELLEKLSKSLDEAYNAASLVSALKEFFIKNFKITCLEVYVFDEKLNLLKDFSKDWITEEDCGEESLKLEEIFFGLNSAKKHIFEKEKTFYALPKRSSSIGILVFENGNREKLVEFLRTASYIISLKIQNLLLAETMQKNIDFHELMRNIAKIIETQYELSYIIPLIGEMIDKFMSNHLIYIFIKSDSKFKLLWPSNCKDKNILNAVNKLHENQEYFLTNNGKTGIFPLVCEHRVLGCMAAKSMGGELSEYDINYLEQLSKQSAITINRANVYAEILKHATLDALTGFYNRRQLEERIKQETAKAKRQKTPLCAIMTDIDFFKRVNDIYGHAAGDLVLKTVSKTMRSQLREYDIAGRYGGEEFALLLPFTKTEEAVMVAERLRKAVENKKIDLSKVNQEFPHKIINVTISVGIYEFKNQDKAEELLKKADKALYEAKETGRNKIVVNYE